MIQTWSPELLMLRLAVPPPLADRLREELGATETAAAPAAVGSSARAPSAATQQREDRFAFMRPLCLGQP